MDITIHTTFLPQDDPEAALAFYRDTLRVEARNAVLRAYSDRRGEVIPPLIRAAEAKGRAVLNINLSTPSLETLFVSLTRRKLD